MASKRFRKNDEIRVPEVFLVKEEGEPYGKVPLEKALRLAEAQDMDLVEVAPNAKPPVCRIMDFGSFLFEQKKKEKAQKKAKSVTEMKGVRFGIRISGHDLEVKLRASRKFLEKGHPVKATLQFRGREIVHDDLGYKKIEEFRKGLEDVSRVDQPPRKQGRQIVMVLVPHKGAKKADDSEE